MRRRRRREIKEKINVPLILSVIAVAVIIGFLYFKRNDFFNPNIAIPTDSEPGLRQDIAQEKEKIPEGPSDTAEPERPALPISAELTKTSCKDISARLLDFFTSLDNQDYIAAYQLTGGASLHFKKLTKKLFTNPPIITRETDNLFTILQNTSHFYRLLGPKNISLAKEILARNKENVESIFADFYLWSTLDTCTSSEFSIHLPLKGLYEYACFFLNTLGGQSYLFRREPSIRLLVTYYSILVLDRANTAELNKYGLDIRQPIESLLKEIDASRELDNKKEYLVTLLTLKDKYISKYGQQ